VVLFNQMARIKYQNIRIPYFYKKEEKRYLITAVFLRYFDIGNRGMIFAGVDRISEIDKEGNVIKLKKSVTDNFLYDLIFFLPYAIFIINILTLIFAVYSIINGDFIFSFIMFLLCFIVGYINSELGMALSKYFLFKKTKSWKWTFDEPSTLVFNNVSALSNKKQVNEAFKILPSKQ